MSSTRRRYLVCYDIADPRRLRRVAKLMQAYGSRIQYSVFECPLDDVTLARLKLEAQETINGEDDQVLFVSLGPEANDATLVIEAIGMPYTVRSSVTIV